MNIATNVVFIQSNPITNLQLDQSLSPKHWLQANALGSDATKIKKLGKGFKFQRDLTFYKQNTIRYYREIK